MTQIKFGGEREIRRAVPPPLPDSARSMLAPECGLRLSRMEHLPKNAARVGPKYPQVVVLVGATGDLSKRKLLPGLFHLCSAGFIPGWRIIGVSLDDIDADGFRKIAREALAQSDTRKENEDGWGAFAETLDYVPLSAGADALKAAVEKAEAALGRESRRVHYLSVPPKRRAARRCKLLAEAGLVERSPHHHGEALRHRPRKRREAQRRAARGLRRGPDLPHRPLPRQGGGAEHPRLPLRQRPVRADLEPQLHRPRADRRAGDARASACAPASTRRPARSATWW